MSEKCITEDIKIRIMEEKDLPQVAAIEKDIFSCPWSENGFRTSLREEATLYLCACIESEVIGYCGFLQVLDEAEITNVAVAQRYRHMGVGEELIVRLLELGRQRGVENFTLEVREGNLPAIALYEKIGFENFGIRKNFYDLPKENAVIMWKRY